MKRQNSGVEFLVISLWSQ